MIKYIMMDVVNFNKVHKIFFLISFKNKKKNLQIGGK